MNTLSRYLQPHPPHARRLLVATLVLAGASAWLSVEAYRLHASAEQHKALSEKLRTRQASLATAKPTRDELEEQKRWAALKQEQDFPWHRVFQAVERTGSPDIELLEFLPEKRNRVIVLRGEARSHEALVAYLDALSMQRALDTVHLVQQQKVVRNRLETLAFEVKASLVDNRN